MQFQTHSCDQCQKVIFDLRHKFEKAAKAVFDLEDQLKKGTFGANAQPENNQKGETNMAEKARCSMSRLVNFAPALRLGVSCLTGLRMTSGSPGK